MPAQKLTHEIIAAAILGCEEQKRQIDTQIAQLRVFGAGPRPGLGHITTPVHLSRTIAGTHFAGRLCQMAPRTCSQLSSSAFCKLICIRPQIAQPLPIFRITLYWNQVLFQDHLVLDNSRTDILRGPRDPQGNVA
jgi:hypothetical protein